MFQKILKTQKSGLDGRTLRAMNYQIYLPHHQRMSQIRRPPKLKNLKRVDLFKIYLLIQHDPHLTQFHPQSQSRSQSEQDHEKSK